MLRTTKPGNMVALLRLDGRLVSTSPAPLGQTRAPTRCRSARWRRASTPRRSPTSAGNAKAIDTRVPPATDMLQDDLYDVLGKKPVVLVFATPQLCQSRVCGPVVDVVEQVKSETKGDVAFIHNEVYVDNNPNKGMRPQLAAYGLADRAVDLRDRQDRQGRRSASRARSASTSSSRPSRRSLTPTLGTIPSSSSRQKNAVA